MLLMLLFAWLCYIVFGVDVVIDVVVDNDSVDVVVYVVVISVGDVVV